MFKIRNRERPWRSFLLFFCNEGEMAEPQIIPVRLVRSDTDEPRFSWQCPASLARGQPEFREINIASHSGYGSGVVRCDCGNPECIITYPSRTRIQLFFDRVLLALNNNCKTVTEENLVKGYHLRVHLNGSA